MHYRCTPTEVLPDNICKFIMRKRSCRSFWWNVCSQSSTLNPKECVWKLLAWLGFSHLEYCGWRKILRNFGQPCWILLSKRVPWVEVGDKRIPMEIQCTSVYTHRTYMPYWSDPVYMMWISLFLILVLTHTHICTHTHKQTNKNKHTPHKHRFTVLNALVFLLSTRPIWDRLKKQSTCN